MTSLRDEDFDPYSFADSTLRVRTKVVARSASDAALIDSTVYWTEVRTDFFLLSLLYYINVILLYYIIVKCLKPFITLDKALHYYYIINICIHINIDYIILYIYLHCEPSHSCTSHYFAVPELRYLNTDQSFAIFSVGSKVFKSENTLFSHSRRL